MNIFKKLRRLQDLEKRLAWLRTILLEDNRWMHHDETSKVLTGKYLALISDAWSSIPIERQPALRERLGLCPHRKKPLKQRIVCAANRYKDGTILIGARHWDPHMHRQIDALGRDDREPPEQGFIDQFGAFYTRTEAWAVAWSNGQIIRRCGGDTEGGGTLYSENLY